MGRKRKRNGWRCRPRHGPPPRTIASSAVAAADVGGGDGTPAVSNEAKIKIQDPSRVNTSTGGLPTDLHSQVKEWVADERAPGTEKEGVRTTSVPG